MQLSCKYKNQNFNFTHKILILFLIKKKALFKINLE